MIKVISSRISISALTLGAWKSFQINSVKCRYEFRFFEYQKAQGKNTFSYTTLWCTEKKISV